MKLSALLIASFSALLISGCVSATATRVTANQDGSTTTDTIKTSAFLENIGNGAYSNGTGMTLSVTSATPDQASIATLAGGVVDLGKAALAFAATKTNSPAVLPPNQAAQDPAAFGTIKAVKPSP